MAEKMTKTDLKAAYGSSGAFGLSVLMLRQGSIILMLISTIFALTLCIGFRLELEPQIRVNTQFPTTTSFDFFNTHKSNLDSHCYIHCISRN